MSRSFCGVWRSCSAELCAASWWSGFGTPWQPGGGGGHRGRTARSSRAAPCTASGTSLWCRAGPGGAKTGCLPETQGPPRPLPPRDEETPGLKWEFSEGLFLHLPVDRQVPGDERVFFVAPNRVKFTWYRDICYHRANRVTPLLAVVAEGADFAPGGPASRVCRAPPPRRLWPVRSGVLWTLPSHAEPTSLGGL